MQSSRSREILVAEANDERRTALCTVVRKLNCVAIQAASAEDVLETITRCRVDVVLLDLDLDLVQMGTTNTLQEIKLLAPMLPVVMMADRMTPALARRLCDRGAHGFLVKPVECDQLFVTLFQYLL